ncbi:PDF receptor-like, partial [Trichoplusia ni]|uniref:PDF receptor-like n=1 Tax=Trichoplusia ni TaxID=7111 RepID=A0A7E5WMZ2_TRINI
SFRSFSLLSVFISVGNLPSENYNENGPLQCSRKYANLTFEVSSLYCNSTYDGFLCWPPTLAGETSHQHCPDIQLSDPTQFAYRRCSGDGGWAGRHANDSSPNGWTNYTPCFPPLVQSLFYKVYDDEGDAQAKFRIAEITRYLEMVGYSISFVALSISMLIFTMYRSLHNRRTLIHRNLFASILVEITIRLALYFDQFFGRSRESRIYGINSIPYLCEAAYVCLEYSVSVMFMWMFIEGIFLNNLVTNRAMRTHWSYTTYFLIGWLAPVVGTVAWAITTGYYYKDETVNKCWYGYNFHWFYWLAQGPRCGIIILNLLFLLNIMRVLVLKLHQTINSDMEKVKKAAHAALILLPLLGMTNVFSMIEAPLDSSVAVFATWCYVTHFFRSFQGLFIAVIYCFLNGEVQTAIRKHYANYRIMREYRRRRRQNVNSISALALRDAIAIREELPMQELGGGPGSSTTNNAIISDPEEDSCTVECQTLCCHRPPTPPRRTPVVVQFADPPLTGECPAVPEDYYDPPRTT